MAAGVRCSIPFSKNCRLQCDLEHHIHTSRITSYRKGAYIIANPLQPVLILEKARQGTDAATDGHVSGCYVTEQPGRGRGGPDGCSAHTGMHWQGRETTPRMFWFWVLGLGPLWTLTFRPPRTQDDLTSRLGPVPQWPPCANYTHETIPYHLHARGDTLGTDETKPDNDHSSQLTRVIRVGVYHSWLV